MLEWKRLISRGLLVTTVWASMEILGKNYFIESIIKNAYVSLKLYAKGLGVSEYLNLFVQCSINSFI